MIVLINSVIYTGGEPFARFASNLRAALWLQSIGATLAERRGERLIFKLPGTRRTTTTQTTS